MQPVYLNHLPLALPTKMTHPLLLQYDLVGWMLNAFLESDGYSPVILLGPSHCTRLQELKSTRKVKKEITL
jgi:hypothetical protein